MLLGHRMRGLGNALSPASFYPANTQGWWLENGELYTDTGFGTKITPGNVVPVFRDLSGRGNHFIQATVAKQAPLVQGAEGLISVNPDGVDDSYGSVGQIDLSATSAATAIFAVQNPTNAGVGIAFEITGDINTSVGFYRFYFAANENTSGALSFGARAPNTFYDQRWLNAFTTVPRTDIISARVNTLGALVTDRWRINRNGVDETNNVTGTLVAASGATNFGSAFHYLMARANSGVFSRVRFYGAALIGRALSDAELFAATNLMLRRTMNRQLISGLIYGANLGDSTVAAYASQNDVADYCNPMTFELKQTLAVPGHTILQQQTAWNNYTNKAATKWVVIQVGLNDLNPAESAATALARYQTLVNTVRAGLPGGAKLYVATMTPCRARLITVYGAVNGPVSYQKWLDMNAAISGTGPNAITGVDGRITSHTAALNDGSGNLAAIYNIGDDIHTNNAARAINGAAYLLALQSGGAL